MEGEVRHTVGADRHKGELRGVVGREDEVRQVHVAIGERLLEVLAEVVIADLGDEPGTRTEDRDSRRDIRRCATGGLFEHVRFDEAHTHIGRDEINERFAETYDIGHDVDPPAIHSVCGRLLNPGS